VSTIFSYHNGRKRRPTWKSLRSRVMMHIRIFELYAIMPCILHLQTEKKKWENDRKKLDATLFETSLDVLKEVLIKFQEMNGGKSLADEVKDLGDFKGTTYRRICEYTFFLRSYRYMRIYPCSEVRIFAAGIYVTDPTQFFVEMLHYSVTGRSTNEVLLMRVVLGTSETNLVEIEQLYQQQYNQPLREKLEVSLNMFQCNLKIDFTQ